MAKMDMTEKEVMKAFDMAKSKFHEAEKEVNKYAKKDPARAMIIAAGVGAAISAMLMLAMSDEGKAPKKKKQKWEKKMERRRK